jgi:hypothetical protein
MSEPSATIRSRREHPGEGQDCTTFVVSFAPWRDRTYVSTSLHRGTYPRGTVLALGGGYLDVSRADLGGLSPRTCITLLCRQLWANGLQPNSEGDGQPIGSGAPLGATGGTVTQDTLPEL